MYCQSNTYAERVTSFVQAFRSQGCCEKSVIHRTKAVTVYRRASVWALPMSSKRVSRNSPLLWQFSHMYLLTVIEELAGSHLCHLNKILSHLEGKVILSGISFQTSPFLFHNSVNVVAFPDMHANVPRLVAPQIYFNCLLALSPHWPSDPWAELCFFPCLDLTNTDTWDWSHAVPSSTFPSFSPYLFWWDFLPKHWNKCKKMHAREISTLAIYSNRSTARF